MNNVDGSSEPPTSPPHRPTVAAAGTRRGVCSMRVRLGVLAVVAATVVALSGVRTASAAQSIPLNVYAISGGWKQFSHASGSLDVSEVITSFGFPGRSSRLTHLTGTIQR